MRSTPNRVLAALVAGVVLLAGIAAVVVANRTALTVEPGTPEAVVQKFVQAVVDGEYPAAADLLASSSGCDLADVARASVPESARVVLTETVVDDGEAVVTVTVTEGSGDDLFGASEYSHTERITLSRDDGSWLVLSSPWLLYDCGSTKG